MYIVVHAPCALLYIAVSACLHGDMVWYSFVQRFEGRNLSGRAPGKNKQRINLRLVFLQMQDYVSVTIHLLRFRLTDMSQDSGAGEVGHHSFRVYWSLRSVCSRSHPARLIRAMVLGSWVSRLKARSGKFLWERFRCKLKDSDDIFIDIFVELS